jgi:DNA-binding NarL/FixJ family response regulator
MAGLMLSSLEPPGSATRPVVRGARTTPLPDPDESLIEARLAELRASGALSGRQLEILVLQVQGASHGDIARVLGITAKTIEHHSREAKVRTGKSLFEHAHDLVADTARTLRSRRV